MDAPAPVSRGDRAPCGGRQVAPPGDGQGESQREQRQVDQLPEGDAGGEGGGGEREEDDETGERGGQRAVPGGERDAVGGEDDAEPAPPGARRRQRREEPVGRGQVIGQPRGAEDRHAERAPITRRGEGVGEQGHVGIDRPRQRSDRGIDHPRLARHGGALPDLGAIDLHVDAGQRGAGRPAIRQRQLQVGRAVDREGEAGGVEDDGRAVAGPAVGGAGGVALAVVEAEGGRAVVGGADDDGVGERAGVGEEERRDREREEGERREETSPEC